MQNLANTDQVFINIEVKARNASPYVLKRVVTVAELGIQARAGGVAPAFDAAAYARGMVSAVPAEREAAQRLHASYLRAVADFQLANGQGAVTPANQLAKAVVDWAIRTSPDGRRFTRNADSQADYVLNEGEVNIARGVVGQEVIWRVNAVGTWGI